MSKPTKPTKPTKRPEARGTYAHLPLDPVSAVHAEPEPGDELVVEPASDLEAAIAAAKAKRPPRRVRETPAWGRKGRPDMVQLNVAIPEHVKRRLAAFAEAHGLHLAEAAEVVLDQHLPREG